MAKTIDQWIEELEAQLKVAEEDVIGDMGEEAWEGGGWCDVTRNLVEMSDAPVEAKREVLRMQGLDQRLDYLGERPSFLGNPDDNDDGWVIGAGP